MGTMKASKIIVLVANKKGDIYQVALQGPERAFIENQISSWHGGGINVIRGKLPIKIGGCNDQI